MPHAANKGRLLTFEDGLIRLGGDLVPGLLDSLRVVGKVRFDDQKIDGLSGKSKTPRGFEDSDVSATLFLITDAESTCYEELDQVSRMFQNVDSKANPRVLAVTNRHLLARGIRHVVFSRLESAESTNSDEMYITLAFVEHNPPIIRIEKQQAKTLTPKEIAEQASKPNKKALRMRIDAETGEITEDTA